MTIFARSTMYVCFLLAAMEKSNAQRVDCGRILADLAKLESTWAAHEVLLERDRATCGSQQVLGAALPALLLKAKNVQVVKSEANLAAELQIRSSVPALLHLLDRDNLIWGGSDFYSEAHLENDAVSKALYELKVQPSELSSLLETPKPRTRQRVVRLLLLMDDRASRELLSSQISRERNPQLHDWLVAIVASWERTNSTPKN